MGGGSDLYPRVRLEADSGLKHCTAISLSRKPIWGRIGMEERDGSLYEACGDRCNLPSVVNSDIGTCRLDSSAQYVQCSSSHPRMHIR